MQSICKRIIFALHITVCTHYTDIEHKHLPKYACFCFVGMHNVIMVAMPMYVITYIILRLYIHNLTSGQVLLKLDFKNAFNCVRHDRMLMVVKESTPELLEFVYSVYIRATILPLLRRSHHPII